MLLYFRKNESVLILYLKIFFNLLATTLILFSKNSSDVSEMNRCFPLRVDNKYLISELKKNNKRANTTNFYYKNLKLDKYGGTFKEMCNISCFYRYRQNKSEGLGYVYFMIRCFHYKICLGCSRKYCFVVSTSWAICSFNLSKFWNFFSPRIK